MSESNKLNVLISYAYFNDSIAEILNKHKHKIRFLLDSGAFTAWKKGRVITIDEYCNFLRTIPIKPWRYFTLDVIGNPKETFENYKIMLDRGFNPIPVFTKGERQEMINTYYETSDIVGIGSLVGAKGNKKYVQWIMRYIGKRKVHWLGFTNLNFMKKYHPYMCDSTSWNTGQMYGSLYIYHGNGKRFEMFKRSDLINRPSKEVISTIHKYGYNYKSLARKEHWHKNNTMTRLSTASWVALSLDVKSNLGTNLFLACVDKDKVERVLNEFYYQTENKRILNDCN